MASRRQFIQSMGSVGLAMGLPEIGRSQPALASQILSPGLTLIRGAGSHVLVAEGDDSVVIVDGGLQGNAEALLAYINRISGNKTIRALFNTNWRPEHSGLNYLLGESGTEIIAHENTRLWQSADTYIEWEDMRYLPMPESARANSTFYKTGSLRLDDQDIEYGYLPRAHTDGDLYIHFPEARVLVAGDVMGASGYPILDYVTGGWIGGIREATDSLIGMADESTRIVAAEGELQSRSDLLAQAEMLTQAYEAVADAFRSGWSLEDFMASDPAADFGERWGDPRVFLTLLYRGTWYHIPGRAVSNIV